MAELEKAGTPPAGNAVQEVEQTATQVVEETVPQTSAEEVAQTTIEEAKKATAAAAIVSMTRETFARQIRDILKEREHGKSPEEIISDLEIFIGHFIKP